MFWQHLLKSMLISSLYTTNHPRGEQSIENFNELHSEQQEIYILRKQMEDISNDLQIIQSSPKFLEVKTIIRYLHQTLDEINAERVINEIQRNKTENPDQSIENISSELDQHQKVSIQISDDVADELQEQIDYLRKQIQVILAQLDTSSEETLELLEKQMLDLNIELEDCYKKIDQLNSELKQEFRQKLDELQQEMVEATTKLSNRVTALEDDVEKLKIDTCIGNLRDGNPQTAIGTFSNIKKPISVIAHIINEVYLKQTSCQTVLIFLNELEVREQGLIAQHETISIGYSTLYDKLVPIQFTPEGSKCAYNLAWRANKLRNELQPDENNSNVYLSNTISKLPKSISHFTISTTNKIKLQITEPIFSGTQICYPREENDVGGKVVTNQVWTTESSDGQGFMLLDPDNRPLIGYPLDFISFDFVAIMLGTERSSWEGKEESLWEPVAVSNEKFYIQRKGRSDEYLSAKVVDTVSSSKSGAATLGIEMGYCYLFALKTEKYEWSV